jgi:hypothetical protein
MLVIATVSEFELAGIVKPFTVGAVVSPVAAGWLVASPGNVRAAISTALVYPSPSESAAAIAVKL